jgi:dTDP-4-dehydro-6-deoxyglucose aminotransferase
MKTSLDDLAIFGGRPAFAEMLHVGRPNIGDRAALFARINAILDSRWLSNAGPFEQEFERRVAERAGVRHCVAVCNGTVALELAIRAADLHGEVLVPSLTFIATAHALRWQGITPVFCDVDPATHNLDPVSVERSITPRTTGILGVHLWGRPCATDALSAIARQHRLKLLYDAAHAFGCTHHGRPIGGFGDLEVFSFHATKVVNAFEGGAVVTNDDGLARKLRLMKNFGFTDYDEVSHLGTNGKMSEVAAAMGLTSLEAFDGFVAVNRRNYRRYRAELAEIPGLRSIAYDEDEANNFQYMVVEVDKASTGVSRDEMVNILWKENVIARRYFFPGCHRMEPYRSHPPSTALKLPDTERLAERLLVLPTGTAVQEDDVVEICAMLRLIVANSGEVRARLDRRLAAPPGIHPAALP